MTYYPTPKTKITPEGGIAIKLVNRTSGDTIKGRLVKPSDSYDGSIEYTAVGAPDIIGVLYEDSIANGSECWVITDGIADVYYPAAVTRGYFARNCVSGDTGSGVGIAIGEALPSSPFATDKHFQEIGHILETTDSAGLAKTVIHFN